MTGRTDGGDFKDHETIELSSRANEKMAVFVERELPYYWSWYRTIFGERRPIGPRTDSPEEAAGKD